MPKRRKVLLGLGGSMAIAGCTEDTDEETEDETDTPEPEEEEPKPPNFAIQDISIDPKDLVQGYSDISIEVILLNKGGKGSQQLSIDIGGDNINEQQIELVENEKDVITISEIESDEFDIGPKPTSCIA